ncbi:Transposase InsO and inactivated derivatives [Pseudoduganella namucuonensis]|uniref:Transposase InsO and inactivated derivatives n=2 Tax=Pseudoduganella namucuonensis TaxID=1035707 RepID=A0A1I7M4V1_9BURK|nr:Transposase InsO and inactivated derivatives [Pseudoduganella namucuonensis]
MHAARNGMTVSKTWVAEVVRAHRYEVADLRRRFKRHVPPAQPCNAVWGIDFTGKADLAKRIHPVLGVIDYGSRSALVLRPLPNRTAITTLKALLAAMETYGVPAAIQTDNEAVFTSRLFRFSLRLLGIRHRLSAPGAPWQNGWIERLFGTLKEKLDRVAVAGFDDLRLAMGEFRFWYNHVRPHQHLQGWTPAEAWRGLDPYAHAPESVEHFSAWDGLLRGVYLRR